ncbi:VacB/RNase II family 3'-5' exoribonuclease [Alloacidobacterium dinghuense]|uniref:Ribonuclease R n=1 Tax=Alloacidobacterium dinghuense TaxID=2763107 RepID=A0A7G8BHF9_9BACT|nr:VacB/RNase II family 3'-5' exoribonuclease [Alloacidobacterium dinghuense]QNI31979.1 VacB/RNase II family 3'-5' exoribonuclease [Alloacidobacterium dinghuense]
MTDLELIRHIERSAGQRAGYKQLVREFGLGGGRERRLLLEHLARLTARGDLIKLDRDQWGIPRAAAARDNLVAGRLDLHRDGFGFVRPTDRARSGEDDIFIPPNELNGAMQGDQVLVELAPPRADGRRLGRIARVLTRQNPTVVGAFHYARSERAQGHTVVPFDERMTQPILIPVGQELPLADSATASPHRVLGEEAKRHHFDDLEGLVVDVEITEWPTPTRTARGRVIEVLGDEDAFGVDVEIVIRKHHLPHVFPDNVLKEARETAFLDPEVVASRRDFRDLPIVTIDGETARDFDDAVLVREHADQSFELQVHIADVAHYVQPNTALDLEARLRGNSVYFPDRAIPMLPQELSTNICSLRPHEDRLVLSCLMQIDAHGDVLSYEITEGVIRSARRMTYTQVHAILDGDEAVRSEFTELVPEFERMHRLALILNKKRERRGSIDFDLPEPIIEFDEFGAMKSVTRSERNWAHRLIEEFMLAANECVASWIENLSIDSIYRIHEKPEPRRIVEFEETAATFGYSLGIGNLPVRKFEMKSDRREQRRGGRTARHHEVPEEIPVTPRMYQRLTAKIAGKPEERILSYLMLRSLKQARYSEKNEGHFALAAPCYTHFTSPIRRYPDLIVHRIAKSLLEAGVSGEGRLLAGEPHALRSAPWQEHQARQHLREQESPIPEPELAAISQESSENERRAAEAERELVEWKKAKFMRDRAGEDFSAMILSATKYGLFVELDDLFIEGLIPIQSLGQLDGDYYTYRENTRQIIGERWGRKFTFGQRVRVVLDRVDAVERRLQFSILEDGIREAAPILKGKTVPSTKSAKTDRKQHKQKKVKRSMQQQSPRPKRFSAKKKKRRK